MPRTLIAISSYGGLPFLEITLREIQRNVKTDNVALLVIVAKPGDTEMQDFLRVRGIPFKADTENRGFASNINDGYDAAFTHGDCDNLIICGNDVVPMPGAIDAMIKTADETSYEMVCGSEFNSRFLVDHYPEARKYFQGDQLIFTDFSARPWEIHNDFRSGIEPHARKDIRNMTLFKRSAFQKVGYADVNFWSNGYYEDNDYCKRCDLLSVSACGEAGAAFYHFTSRTIFQSVSRDHGVLSHRNHAFFREKWGGDPGHEAYTAPFHGDPYKLGSTALSPDLKISSREQEDAIISYWRNK